MKLTFVSTGLAPGGAEFMLCRLVEGMIGAGHECSVVSLTETGRIGNRLRALGIQVQALELRRSVPSPTVLPRLARILRNEKANVIQTWMYHADLLGGLAVHFGDRVPLVWGVRQSDLDPRHSPRMTRYVARACARISWRVPQRIVCCSRSALEVHRAMGYDPSKMQVIENGFDNELWKPSEQARAGLRQELELPDDALVIGFAARFDMQKDHENFFRAAHILSKKHPDTHFLLCGQGIDHQNRRLIEIMQQCEMTGNVHLLGDRDDMHRVTAAFDIATMSSAYGEGFPNVIGEAMACEVCCVATDVGDAGRIIGNTGWLVPKRDPEALAASWAAAIEAGVTERRRMGRSARDRVKVKFSLGRSIRAYQDLYHGLTH